ncbi:MAG: PKD domain-containing protein, partial [Microvirga sp.]
TDYAAQYPYAHGSSLFDVLSGSNGSCTATYLCTAGAGYDGPTGLGAPNTTAGYAAGTASTGGGSTGGTPPANRPPTVSVAKSCVSKSCTFSATANDPDGTLSSTSYRWSNVSSVSLSGTSATANYASPGTYTSSVTVTDSGNATASASSTVSCAWSGKGSRKTLVCK